MSLKHRRFLPSAAMSFAALLHWLLPTLPAAADESPPQVSPAPLALGFEEELVGAPGSRFSVPTPGWSARLVENVPAEGARCARLSRDQDSPSKFGNLMGVIDAAPYRGKRVRLSSQMRLPGAGEVVGQGQMWLRVDRPEGRMGGFDNMQDRPLRQRRWAPAVIELDVEEDAVNLALGWMALQGATILDVDAVELRVVGDATPAQAPSPAAPLSDRGLENLRAATRLLSLIRFFHPSDQAVGVVRWDLVAIELMERAEGAADAAELAGRLQNVIEPLAPTVQLWVGGKNDGPPPHELPAEATSLRAWRHNGVQLDPRATSQSAYRSLVLPGPVVSPVDDDGRAAMWYIGELGGGISCRVPLKVPADSTGSLPHGATPAAWGASAPAPRLTVLNRTTRLADVATAWGVFQHFYPYFDEVEVDWDAVLDDSLRRAAVDVDAASALATLRRLVASLHDGHGSVWSRDFAPSTALPLALRWCGDELVVVGTRPPAPEAIRPGDVLLSIDDRPSEELLADVAATISAATPGWLRYRAAGEMAQTLPTEDPARLRLRRPDGQAFEIQVPRGPLRVEPISVPSEHRPANGSELAPGILYFDLNGAESEALAQAMPRLREAKGIVFDLRGYPAEAAYSVIQHLIDKPVASAHWNIPVVTRPDRQGWTWNASGRWEVQPKAPRLRMPVAFLTDGRAISYAESIMGIVEAYKLGEIVGEATAGTNGNVNPFVVPGGASIAWTGMKVLKHDGSRHHGVGIAPTVRVVPSPAGVAEARDEAMEAAVRHLRKAVADSAP